MNSPTHRSATAFVTGLLAATSFSCSRPNQDTERIKNEPTLEAIANVPVDDPKERLSSALKDPVTGKEMKWARYLSPFGNLYVVREDDGSIMIGDFLHKFWYFEGRFRAGTVMVPNPEGRLNDDMIRVPVFEDRFKYDCDLTDLTIVDLPEG